MIAQLFSLIPSCAISEASASIMVLAEVDRDDEHEDATPLGSVSVSLSCSGRSSKKFSDARTREEGALPVVPGGPAASGA